MNYLRFLRDNWRFVGFGFVMSLSSSFGQTFYNALSGADIRAEFGLTHGGFGAWFAVATIVSAATLIWLGRIIDRVDLRWYTLAVCSGMVVAMLVIASAPTVAILAVGLYLARLNGQGLMVHISTTSMGRYFDADRGKAISVAAMGQSWGEAILPHDAKAREKSTGFTVVDAFWERWKGPVHCFQSAPNPIATVQAARLNVPRSYFDERGCEKGLARLKSASYVVDAKTSTVTDRIKHDDNSHCLDSFRYAAWRVESSYSSMATNDNMGTQHRPKVSGSLA